MTRPELTPAAQRAFDFAARFAAPHDTQLGACQLLFGLLEEPECRAALLLAARGIGPLQVREHWRRLVALAEPLGDQLPLGPEVRQALAAAELRLFDYPRPHELATEHLLLGLAVGENDVATWFHERGIDVDALEAEIHFLAGHQPGPLAWDDAQRPGLSTAPPAPAVDEIATLRILDAAANRAGEGLRVVEDYVRFALDDRFLAAECKALRHELTAALAELPLAERFAARETRADVGATLSIASEQRRDSLAQVAAASFARLEQAMRSLEEYAKTRPPGGAAFESLRYRTYTLERAVGIGAESRQRLADARLYVLTDGRSSSDEFARLTAALVTAGVDMIQLRDKRLADRELLGRARRLREQTAGTQTLFVMNDRPDLAVLAQADGVHVGQEELTVKDARSIVGSARLIGVSTHSVEQARAAVLDGANYIGVGPTFASRTKQFSHLAGLELLQTVSREIALPAFAIGGIGPANVAEVRRRGFSRIAVSAAVTDAADPAAAVAELRRMISSDD